MPLIKRFRTNKFKTGSGFTLIELMVTIGVAGVLAGIAIPSFKSTIQNNRLTTSANELVTALNLARSEAVKRGLSVTVRKVDSNSSTNLSSTANWEDGWDVFTDADSDGNFESGDVLIRNFTALPNSYTLRGNVVATPPPDGFDGYISFNSRGRSHNSGYFVLCDDSDGNQTAEANTSRLIIVNTVGRVQIGTDTNSPKDGIPNIDSTTNSTDCTP
jgi:type IV fimbrial biogenesis protein FimT